MSDTMSEPQVKNERVEEHWAPPMSTLKAREVPSGATNINVEGKQVVSPMQGFGQLWEKKFRVRMVGCKLTPAEVVKIWKANFTKFQPNYNRFHPTREGVTPGEVMFIDSAVPVVPGTPGLLPITTGVMVLYADDSSFTVITPEGHPESGWNTFSAYEQDGVTVAQIQTLTRATDPIYEFGYRFMGGAQMQDEIWTHVIRQLAKACGVQAEVESEKTLVDGSLQWDAAGNIWENAVFHTIFYRLGAPLRWARNRLKGSR